MSGSCYRCGLNGFSTAGLIISHQALTSQIHRVEFWLIRLLNLLFFSTSVNEPLTKCKAHDCNQAHQDSYFFSTEEVQTIYEDADVASKVNRLPFTNPLYLNQTK